jgi:[ribosomal protein S5]-alanine N-acetyltransferase
MERGLLKTPRLLLQAATPETMEAAAGDDPAALSRALAARVPADWPPRIGDDGRMAREGFAYVRDLLRRDPSLVGWWGWWVMLAGSSPVLIGAVSPKGPPDPEGTVEVSYGIVHSHQGHGYATEATQALMNWLRKNPQVTRIIAETFPTMGASIAVMEKCGMAFLGEGSEPGTIRYGLQVARS